MTSPQLKSTEFYSVPSDQNICKKTKISSFAEIWEDKETAAKSLHATRQFLPGKIIADIGIKEYVEQPSYLSVQVDQNKHIMLAPEYLQYINHSCDPNVHFDTTNMVVRCLRKIEIGEAMTFFYPSTEWSMTQGFDCLCGSKKCLKKIEGAAHLSPDILKNYKLSDYIVKTKMS